MKQFILAITGPAGAGKSTISKVLAKQIEQCVNIDADHVKHFIVNGFIYDETPAGIRQWELLGENIGTLARNFQDIGFNVIINGYINEPAWAKIQYLVTLNYKVLLLPHIDMVINRDLGRDADVVMGSATVKVHHDYFSTSNYYNDYIKIDSTEYGVDETVQMISDIIKDNI